MKKGLLLCLTVIMLSVLTATGNAEQKRYAIRELPVVTSPVWRETYQAHGRTIAVNEEIIIPSVEIVPVLTVRVADPIPEPRPSALKSATEKAAAADPSRLYEFRSNSFSTYLGRGMPAEVKGDDDFAIGQKTHGLFDFDGNAAYADENALSVSEAFSIAQELVGELFPGERMYLRNVALWDHRYWKKNGAYIDEKGHYALECAQVFHRIPLMASIHNAFFQLTVGEENSWLDCRGLIWAHVYDAVSSSVVCWLYQEIDVMHEDVPLIPFDAVKPQMGSLS